MSPQRQAELAGFIASCDFAVVSYLSPEGAPQSAVVGIAVTPELEIIFDTVASSRKYRNLKARPRCSIVMWTGEFGRLPISQGTDGRDHNRHAFSLWLAGGGFKRGCVYGATDEFGYRSIESVVRVSGLHATLLHALGLDHTKLTFPHEGRDDTLTDVVVTRAEVVRDLLA